jgi:DNA end-binding protein Ku
MPRGIWKGSLNFGLVNIGVELIPMEAPERLDLDMIDRRDMARIGYQKINKVSGEPVEQEDIAKGYRISDNKYVLLDEEDLKAANPKATQSLELLGFLPLADIPPVYFAKPYLLAPTKGSEKAYRLLLDALEDAEQVGLGRVVVRTRQYLCAVYPYQKTLVAQLLRYDEELRDPADLGVTPPRTKPLATELTMAQQLLKSMATDWEAAAYKDEYRADLMSMIKKRAKKGTRAVQATPAPAEGEARVLDLMTALKRSMANTKKPAAKPKRATPRRRPSARSA